MIIMCARARARARDVRIFICIFWILFVWVRATGKAHCTQVRELTLTLKFSVKYKDDPNWWTHSLLREGYGKHQHWVTVLLRFVSRDSAWSLWL
jgi:hypothetical protein